MSAISDKVETLRLVTMHRNRFPFKAPTRRTNYPNFILLQNSLHVSGNLLLMGKEFAQNM